ncbi:MAG: hypothetical protein RI897_3127 [Verrucomicrobiota bacterium]|jgi:hypothetical protein
MFPNSHTHPSKTRLPLALALWTALNLYLPHCQAELHYNHQQAQLSADINRQPLQSVLESLSEATGWSIHVDPSLTPLVSTRFQNLKITEALRRILESQSYSWIATSNANPSLFVYGSSPADATLKIAPHTPLLPESQTASAENPQPHELIVRLTGPEATNIHDLAASVGAKVTDTAGSLNAYKLEFADQESLETARNSLLDDPSVAAIESNIQISPPQTTTPYAGNLGAQTRLIPKAVPNDQQIVVAILDTPVSQPSAELNNLLLPALSVGDPSNPPSETVSHGTAMAETLYSSLASASDPETGTPVRILPIDIYGGKEATTTFDVLDGLLLAAAGGARVINLSLGGNEPSPMLQDAVQALRAQGVIVIAAAGNEPTTNPVFPAAYPEVLAVTAADRSGDLADYANRGEFIDLIAPGTSVFKHDQQAYLGTGTSYAAAYISGQAAAYFTQPQANPEAVDALLRQQFGLRQKPGPP